MVDDKINIELTEENYMVKDENGEMVPNYDLTMVNFNDGDVVKGRVVKIEKDDRTNNKEALELAAIEAGAEDLRAREYEEEEFMEIIVQPEDLERAKQNLVSRGIKIESASLDWVAKEYLEIDDAVKAKCQKLFEDLDEHEAIHGIYSNLAI